MDKTEAFLDNIPAKQIPPWRYKIAHDGGIKKIMATTWGGLGDQVVAEPTLRYMFKLFEGYKISLLTSFPEIFDHLPFERIYHKSEARSLDDSEWLVIHTNPMHDTVTRDFIHHHFTQVVDFCSLAALQRQLPLKDRQVELVGTHKDYYDDGLIVIHPGRHWEIKTFPKWWWDKVISGLNDVFPDKVVIVGRDMAKDTGTVNVDIPMGVIDLRNKQSLKELIGILKAADVVVTNDSSPLHIAAAGDANIYFLATCKEPEYLMHWRENLVGNMVFGWKMHNLAKDGLWNHQSSIPIRNDEFTIDRCPAGLMEKILPDPDKVIQQIVWGHNGRAETWSRNLSAVRDHVETERSGDQI